MHFQQETSTPQSFENELRSTLARIEAKLDILFNARGDTQAGDRSADLVALSNYTPKQHAIIQMLLRDAKVGEIAERFNLSENTVKTHVQLIVRKMNSNRKVDALTKLAPIFSRVSPEAYLQVTNGLPKDWDATFSSGNIVNRLVINED